jgi:peptide/nickel transport system substrate-binding protein
VAAWKPSAIHLTAYAKYWGKAPAITDVRFLYDDDGARVLTAAKRGELDIVPALIPAHWPEQSSAPGIELAFSTVPMPQPRLRYVAFDAVDGPTADPVVRRALSLLIDRKGLATEVYDGLAVATAGPVWPGGPISGPAAEVPPFDPAAAALLLDGAGYRDSDGDGVRDQGGVQLSINALVVEMPDEPTSGPKRGVPARDRIIEAWRRAGLVVNVREGTDAVIQKRLATGAADVVFLERTMVADLDLSSWLGTGGVDNLGRFASPAVDTLLARIGADWDPGSRATLAPALAQALLAEAPIAAIVADVPQALVSRRVQGLEVWGGWFDLTNLSLAP